MIRLFADSIFYHCTIHQSKKRLPYLLMFHGFMGSGEVFNPLINKLCSFCNPVTIDLAGHGKTETPDKAGLFTAERQSAQIHSLLNRLQFAPLYLYGYSMGGRLAFQMLAKYSHLFDGAVIESAHCGIQSEKDREVRIQTDKKRAEQIEENFRKFVDDWLILPLFKHTPDEAARHYEKIIRAQKPELMSRVLKEFGAGVMPDVCKNILKIKKPVDLICGSLDEKYVNRLSELSEGNENINLHIVEKAGHRVHTGQPDEVLRILEHAMKA